MAAPIDVMFLRDTHHGGPADQAATVAQRLAAYADSAAHSLDKSPAQSSSAHGCWARNDGQRKFFVYIVLDPKQQRAYLVVVVHSRRFMNDELGLPSRKFISGRSS